jgi:hypothetical protein
MNRSIILRPLAIVAVVALTSVGLERGVAALSRASSSAATTQAQVQVAAQPTATAMVTAPPPAQVQVEGLITAVDPVAGTITIQDEDGPTSVVSVNAAGTYHVGQEVEVVGTLTGPGGSAATVQARVVQVEASKATESTEAAEAPEATESTEAAEAPDAAEPPEVPEPPDND